MNWNQYINQHIDVLRRIDTNQLDSFVNGLRTIIDNNNTLWLTGNGGSASTASHMVADFNKTTTQFGGRSLKSVALSDMVALTTAFSNDVDFHTSLANCLRIFAEKSDGLLSLSVSGTSPNILSAITEAKNLEVKTFAIFGEKGKHTLSEVGFPILVESSDYQVVENVQLVVLHWVTKCI